jgi:hypothetical protein
MLLSPVKTIDRLHFVTARNAKPFNAEKMVVVDGMVIAKLPNGRVYTSWESVSNFALPPSEWRGQSLTLLKGLVALKIIRKHHLDAHMERVKRIADYDEIKYDREKLEELNKKYGTNLEIPELLPCEAVDETLTLTMDDLKRIWEEDNLKSAG